MLIGCGHASQPCYHLLCLFTVLQASLDRQVRDLQAQLDEATGSAARAAKKEAASLRQRVSEHACKCMDTHTQTHTRTHTHTLTHRHMHAHNTHTDTRTHFLPLLLFMFCSVQLSEMETQLETEQKGRSDAERNAKK